MSNDDLSTISSVVFALIGIYRIYMAFKQYKKDTEDLDRHIEELQGKIQEIEQRSRRRNP